MSDQQKFSIPKQTDRALVEALTKICNEMRAFVQLVVRVSPHYSAGTIDLNQDDPTSDPSVQYVLSENSEIMPQLYLSDSRKRPALSITRQTQAIVDTVTVNWNEWAQYLPEDQRSKSFVKLMSLARKHLRATDVEADLTGNAENEWGRYRESQQAVVNSLEQTLKSIAVDYGKRVIESETTSKAKYDALAETLRNENKALSERLNAEHERRLNTLQERERAIIEREKSFNTKEARYVARQQQQIQIDELKEGLKLWSLTKGTQNKRWPVAMAYWAGICITLALTAYFSFQSFELLQGKELSQIAWWQWTLLSIKSILPFAAFATFLTYFIRWSSAWARQHADEEFRNRSRVLDIGRSAWLMEAVRDAQDNKTQIPAELMKELSKNLFNYSGPSDGADLHPQLLSDYVMQGLASIRVKSPDGSEVEAKRGRG